MARPGLWNKPTEKDDLHKHTHTETCKILMPQNGKARELHSVHVLHFLALPFLDHNINAQMFIFQNKKHPLKTLVSMGGHQRIAHTRVTHHTAEHPLDGCSAVSRNTRAQNAPGLFPRRI